MACLLLYKPIMTRGLQLGVCFLIAVLALAGCKEDGTTLGTPDYVTNDPPPPGTLPSPEPTATPTVTPTQGATAMTYEQFNASYKDDVLKNVSDEGLIKADEMTAAREKVKTLLSWI